jgi:hypothetical protein
MGVRLPERKGATAASIIPRGGLPHGMQLLHHLFALWRQGQVSQFLRNRDQLFDIMEGFENSMKVQTFFVMDENFLLHRKRAIQLLEHRKTAGKSWGLAVFASARAIRKYSMQELVELGVSWIWMGLESVNSKYAKLEGQDTHALTQELRKHGIRVQGSTIIGLEHHTPTNIAEEIENAVSHETDFHQFMLYTPVPARRSMRRCGYKAACSIPSTSPIFTASSSSTSSMPRFRGTILSASLTSRSSTISSAMDRASTACAKRC